RLPHRGTAVDLEDIWAVTHDAVAVDGGNDRLAGEAVAEVIDAVVVPHDLDVAVIVPVVECPYLAEGTRQHRTHGPATQRRPVARQQAEDQSSEMTDEQQGEDGT